MTEVKPAKETDPSWMAKEISLLDTLVYSLTLPNTVAGDNIRSELKFLRDLAKANCTPEVKVERISEFVKLKILVGATQSEVILTEESAKKLISDLKAALVIQD